ncbi:hypothetical protein [Microcoleus sp. bin38.metabat.b11b12b14.051]|uniref:hypothetical protein n=1 Tax=Microcoleus sp. bin38.metabat.b11b12b14.051 TaxID=2742709 RepID=UPI0025FCEB31|nr:hypothetical protein [Microcoleus sp. bin38.metabat.b11b12b14.051]
MLRLLTLGSLLVAIASTVPSAIAQPIAISPNTAHTKQQAIAEATIEPAIFSPAELGESFHRNFEKIEKQPCNEKLKTEKSVRYRICTVNQGNGKTRIVSASEANIEVGDGMGYWFTETGKVYAIRFFHSGQTFIFGLKNGSLLAELIEKRRVNMDFKDAQKKALEKSAREGGKSIIQRFK